MKYYTCYESPIGELLLIAEGESLIEVSFDCENKQKLEEKTKDMEEGIPAILMETIQWLDLYFEGKEPNWLPNVKFHGTDFQKKVWSIIATIPYGETKTYGEIGKMLAAENPSGRMSAQAVGQATGSNPIAIVVPCHRVMGQGGKLTGYGGGLVRKKVLLCLEKIPYVEESEEG